MFIELLWPKDLKKLVKKYHNEGNINDVAVKNIKNATYKYLVVMVIFALILIFTSEVKGGVILLLTPLVVKFDLHRIFYNQIEPYVLGKRVEARFVEVTHYLRNRGWEAIYEKNNGMKIICKVGTTVVNFKEDGWPKKNQITYIYQSNLNKSKGMPDIQYFKQKCSLTTSIL
jgi:hypothetical protein